MKKLVLTLIALIASVSTVNAGQYLKASPSITQCPGTAPEVVTMDIVDATNGITLADNRITVGEGGSYLIVAAPQVGGEGAGPFGCFDAPKTHCKIKLSEAKARIEKIAFEGSEPAGLEFADHG